MGLRSNCLFIILLLIIASCTSPQSDSNDAGDETGSVATFTGARNEVKLMTLDPGHFHAALVQKYRYDQVDDKVNIYAPEGDDLKQHLDRIERFNTRQEDPTTWQSKIYTGPDFLEKMLAENLVM